MTRYLTKIASFMRLKQTHEIIRHTHWNY